MDDYHILMQSYIKSINETHNEVTNILTSRYLTNIDIHYVKEYEIDDKINYATYFPNIYYNLVEYIIFKNDLEFLKVISNYVNLNMPEQKNIFNPIVYCARLNKIDILNWFMDELYDLNGEQNFRILLFELVDLHLNNKIVIDDIFVKRIKNAGCYFKKKSSKNIDVIDFINGRDENLKELFSV